MRKKREASALCGVNAGQPEVIWASETTAANFFSLQMDDGSSQQDEGIAQRPGPIFLLSMQEKNLLISLATPGHSSHDTERQKEQLLAQDSGLWLLEDAVLTWEAASAASGLQMQKMITRIACLLEKTCY